jgi:polyvinyl alcohol dehydrogenase (cytochrome)
MNGKIIWKQRVGSGGTMGGVHWGMSTNDKQIFVGVSDLPTNNPYNVGPANPGLHSLDIKTGKFLWRNNLPNVCPKEGKFLCFPGISAAVSSSTDLVYAGGLDGMLRVFSAKDGTVLWKYNSNQKIETVNGIAGLGGSIESDGPVIAFDKLFVTSGYDKWGEAPGNILLVFSIDGK